jgi:hypothetical protein
VGAFSLVTGRKTSSTEAVLNSTSMAVWAKVFTKMDKRKGFGLG